MRDAASADSGSTPISFAASSEGQAILRRFQQLEWEANNYFYYHFARDPEGNNREVCSYVPWRLARIKDFYLTLSDEKKMELRGYLGTGMNPALKAQLYPLPASITAYNSSTAMLSLSKVAEGTGQPPEPSH